MSNLHVIYRRDRVSDGEQWGTYSHPHGIYTAAATLVEARAEFREAARFSLGADEFDQAALLEHLEQPVPGLDGVFIRTAIDRPTLDRDAASATMQRALTDPAQRARLEERSPLAASGDIVIVACVPTDTLGWVLGQMGPSDALVVCAQISDVGMWWSFLAGERAVVDIETTETLADADLGFEATISDLMRDDATSSGRRVAALAGG